MFSNSCRKNLNKLLEATLWKVDLCARNAGSLHFLTGQHARGQISPLHRWVPTGFCPCNHYSEQDAGHFCHSYGSRVLHSPCLLPVTHRLPLLRFLSPLISFPCSGTYVMELYMCSILSTVFTQHNAFEIHHYYHVIW